MIPLQAAQDTTVTIVLAPDSGTSDRERQLHHHLCAEPGLPRAEQQSYQVCEIVGPIPLLYGIGLYQCSRLCRSLLFPNGFLAKPGDGVMTSLSSHAMRSTLLHRCRYSTDGVTWYGKRSGGYKNNWTVRTCRAQQHLTAPIISSIKYNDGSGRSQARFVVINDNKKQ